MSKPAKINSYGIQLLHEPDGVTFSTFVEVKQNHGIVDRATVKLIKTGVCIDGTLHDYEWSSEEIELARDLSQGSKWKRYFRKLTLTLTVRNTGTGC